MNSDPMEPIHSSSSEVSKDEVNAPKLAGTGSTAKSPGDSRPPLPAAVGEIRDPDSGLTRNQRRGLYWKGVLGSSLVGFFASVFLPLIYRELDVLAGRNTEPAVLYLGYATFLGVPVAMGIMASWTWQPLKMRWWHAFFHAAVLTFFGLLMAAVALREGVICLIMASPILYLLNFMGILIGDMLFKIRHRPLYSSLVPLAVLTLWADVNRDVGQSLVQDAITIRATPEEIWPRLLNTSRIDTPSGYWMTRLGLPEAVQTETRGSGVGSQRFTRLSDGQTVKTRVTQWQANKRLATETTHQPHHPEITGHIDVVRGSMELVDNKDGTTTLVRSHWYRLHVQPLAYFRLFADSALRNSHRRTLEKIKTLSETTQESSQ